MTLQLCIQMLFKILSIKFKLETNKRNRNKKKTARELCFMSINKFVSMSSLTVIMILPSQFLLHKYHLLSFQSYVVQSTMPSQFIEKNCPSSSFAQTERKKKEIGLFENIDEIMLMQ